MASPHKQPFNVQQRLWLRMVVSGAKRQEILREVFKIDPADKVLANRCDQKMYRWRHHPDFEKEWNKAYREVWSDITYEAIRELKEGMHDEALPWRRTQHVNMALVYGTKLLTGEDSNTVKVQIQGLPDLGEPDQDDG